MADQNESASAPVKPSLRTIHNNQDGPALPGGYSFGNPPPMGNEFFGSMLGIEPPMPQSIPMRNYRPYSLGQPYDLRQRLKHGKVMTIGGLAFCNADIARLLAGIGYDLVFVDWEHSPMSIRELTELIRWVNYASEGNTAVVVRVPNFEHTYIAWALDAGASGIIIPHCETVEQAKSVVAAARFPYGEGGKRSFPPFGMWLGVNDGAAPGKILFDIWNTAAVILQIESGLGANNAEELLSVPGVDAVMVGHGDLRMDLGLMPGSHGPEPIYLEAVDKICKAAQRNKLPMMSFVRGHDDVVIKAKQGVTLFICGADGFMLAAAARANVAETKKAIEDAINEGATIEL